MKRYGSGIHGNPDASFEQCVKSHSMGNEVLIALYCRLGRISPLLLGIAKAACRFRPNDVFRSVFPVALALSNIALALTIGCDLWLLKGTVVILPVTQRSIWLMRWTAS
ncbi:uncharacterized protein BP01DRAFT_187932 [Aspergillus saccharolyticus JOP 1030-1]|uniref:Uncharacterized protein n=1 Tax=Aspergillus saccharolyticus JOP 1030-1 TaxID=1450539 RepID=A0A318ZC57_9EURO|nr:hypothetical protein BP01DRAFT_187932 [Aspergillus saccharolyticus JOP 1030-1]PYH41070.1 hypothetical protein BP01DRAFT_187932 [Aspergillus saccharolyticus JOP 1030-1]